MAGYSIVKFHTLPEKRSINRTWKKKHQREKDAGRGLKKKKKKKKEILLRQPYPAMAEKESTDSLGEKKSMQALAVSVQPPCAIACINICAHVKNPRTGSHTRVWTHENTACTVRNGSAALVTAVASSG